MFDLTGKSAVVTGAGSGIGAAIAVRFAKAGAHVFIAELNEDAGRALAAEIASAGGRATFLPCDVADEASCRNVAAAVLSACDGYCDILVNNAGIGCVGTILQTKPADLDRLYSVNVRGVMHMTQAILPPMLERKWGSVISLASVGGVVGIRDRFAYCTTKFAVVGMTKCMALDHAETKVRFNCICPGRVETPWIAARLKDYPDPEEAYRQMAATQALNRLGTPEEVAAAAHYLAADESAFVTGSALLIDGGFSSGK